MSQLLNSFRSFVGGPTVAYSVQLRNRLLGPEQNRALSMALQALGTTNAPVAKARRDMTELVWLLEYAADVRRAELTAEDAFMVERLPTFRSMSAADAVANPLMPASGAVRPLGEARDPKAAPARPAPAAEAAKTSPDLDALAAQFLSPAERDSLHGHAVDLMRQHNAVFQQDVLAHVLSLWIIDAALRKPLQPLTPAVHDTLVAFRSAVTKADREAKRLAASRRNPVLDARSRL